MSNKNQSGFSIVLVAIVTVLVIGLIGYVGWSAYHQSQTKVASTTPSNSTSSTPPKETTTAATTTTAGTYLDIKELGIKITLDDSIKDATYTYDPTLNAQSDPQQVSISTKSLVSTSSTACILGTIIRTNNQNLTGAPLVPNGSTIFKLGNYYYYLNNPQALCTNNTAANQLETLQQTTFRNDFKTIQPDN